MGRSLWNHNVVIFLMEPLIDIWLSFVGRTDSAVGRRRSGDKPWRTRTHCKSIACTKKYMFMGGVWPLSRRSCFDCIQIIHNSYCYSKSRLNQDVKKNAQKKYRKLKNKRDTIPAAAYIIVAFPVKLIRHFESII